MLKADAQPAEPPKCPESFFVFVFGFEEVRFHVLRGPTEWATWQETVGSL